MPPTPLPSESANIAIWIIEDHEAYRTDLVGVFSEEIDSIDCIGAYPSYESAEQTLRSSAPRNLPDVVLMDIQLPGISGIEAIPKLQAHLPAVEVIMLTTFSDKRRVFDSICAGASGYLLKTDDIHDIARGIHEVYHGGSSLNGQVAHMVLNMFSHLGASTGEHDLTGTELEILRFLADGLQKKEIATELNLAEHQVNYHVRNIYKKLHVNSLSGAVAKAIRKGFIY